MADAQALKVRQLDADEAARRLAGVERLDPSGMTPDAATLARSGRAYAVEGEGADAVYVVAVRNGVAFVVAAKGGGELDHTDLIDSVITAQARGLEAVACQTARPGLVRKLQRRGWRVTGWVLRKELAP